MSRHSSRRPCLIRKAIADRPKGRPSRGDPSLFLQFGIPAEGQIVALESDAGDGVHRRRNGLIVTPYDIPRGCLGAYYPEANVLMPVEHNAEESDVPSAKSVPVRIRS